MGQQDPLVAWQKEGYAMFGNLVSSVDDDFVKYAMHVDVVVEKPDVPDLSQALLEGPVEPVQSLGGSQAAVREAAQVAQAVRDEAPAPAPEPEAVETMQPKVRSEHEKVGRNEPCWCGSGKKYKHCHAR